MTNCLQLPDDISGTKNGNPVNSRFPLLFIKLLTGIGPRKAYKIKEERTLSTVCLQHNMLVESLLIPLPKALVEWGFTGGSKFGQGAG